MIARRLLTVAVVLLLAGGLVWGVARLLALAETSAVRATMPEGWMLIRPPHEVSALAVRDGTVWAGGRDGLYAIDRATGELLLLPEGAPRMRYVKGLLVDSADTLWVAHLRGLSCLDDGGWHEPAEGAPDGPCMSVFEDRAGVVWVGTEQGLVWLQGGRWERVRAPGLDDTTVDVIFQDRDGAMWFGSAHPTQGALARLDGGAWSTFGVEDGLPHASVNDIIQDREGTIWVGTGFARRGGAARLDKDRWHALMKEDGLAGEKVRSIYEDARGRLWFASEYDGVAIRERDDWLVLTPQQGLAGHEVKDTVADDRGVLWLGTENGVSRVSELP